MSIEVTHVDPSDRAEWNSLVERSAQASVFHRYEALETLADHADATLQAFVGRKGQEPVGIFPVFRLSRGPITAVFSPPPRLLVPYLGPALLNQDKLKQRKRERRHRAFLDACLDEIDASTRPRYTKLIVGPGYDDTRPFKWRDFDATPLYTYEIDLTRPRDDLLDRFSSDARRNVRDGEGVDYRIEEGGADAAEGVVDQVRARYERQGRPYGVEPGFVTDLYDRLPEGTLRPYTCHVEDEFVGGMLVLQDEDTVYRWQGGVTPDIDVDLAVNDHLDWRVMGDAMDRGLSAYDLVGAGVPRINDYKAKFNPRVRSFYALETGTWPVTKLVDAYRKLA